MALSPSASFLPQEMGKTISICGVAVKIRSDLPQVSGIKLVFRKHLLSSYKASHTRAGIFIASVSSY